MEKQSVHRINVSKDFLDQIKELRGKLKERDVEDFSTEELMDSVLEDLKAKHFIEFLERKTPLSYKLKTLLADEKSKKDLENFISKYPIKNKRLKDATEEFESK